MYGAVLLLMVRRVFISRFNVPSESALAQPPLLVFILSFVVSLPLRRLVTSVDDGARPLALDAPSGNSPRLI